MEENNIKKKKTWNSGKILKAKPTDKDTQAIVATFFLHV